jgi:hypothetical protein
MKKFFKWVGIVLSGLVGFGFLCSPGRNSTMEIAENHGIPFCTVFTMFF